MTWNLFFEIESKKDYYNKLIKKVETLYNEYEVRPLKDDIFKAFSSLNFSDIKVVILGQDPYPTKGVATGLSFATYNNTLTKSLKNICLNIGKDPLCADTSLLYLVKQGVFLLNKNLIIIPEKPNICKNIGFEKLTLNAIKFINDNLDNVVFILWGKDAIKVENVIDTNKHYIIKSSHPSPLSYKRRTKDLEAFCNVNFSNLTNDYLKKHNKKIIKW